MEKESKSQRIKRLKIQKALKKNLKSKWIKERMRNFPGFSGPN